MERIHPIVCQGKTPEEIAYEVNRMRYDAVIRFIRSLSENIYTSAIADSGRGREKLASALEYASKRLCDVELAFDEAWRISRPHMTDELSQNPEIADRDFGLPGVIDILERVEESWYNPLGTTNRDVSHFLKTYMPSCTVVPEVEDDDGYITLRWVSNGSSLVLVFNGRHEVIIISGGSQKFNIWDRDGISSKIGDPTVTSILYPGGQT